MCHVAGMSKGSAAIAGGSRAMVRSRCQEQEHGHMADNGGLGFAFSGH